MLQNTSGMCEFSQAGDVCGATTDNSEAATDDDSDDGEEEISRAYQDQPARCRS